MRNFRRKTTWKGVIESKPVLMVLCIVVLAFGWNVIRFWGKMEETEKKRLLAEDRVEALREKKKELEFNTERLNTDEGKEEFFRKDLGLAREGEQMIIIVGDERAGDAIQKTSPGPFSFIKNWFR